MSLRGFYVGWILSLALAFPLVGKAATYPLSEAPLTKEQQSLFDLGCSAIQNGYCRVYSYNPSYKPYQMIQLAHGLVYHDQFELDGNYKWIPALNLVLPFVRETLGSEKASELESQVKKFIVQDQLNAVINLAPTKFCDNLKECHYIYFYVFFKDGQLLFFELRPNLNSGERISSRR